MRLTAMRLRSGQHNVDLLSILANASELACADAAVIAEQAHVCKAKTVRKPWGSERWLVPEGSPFGFKIIALAAGKRTSLQYHREKEEANLVAVGEGRAFLADDVNSPLTEHPLTPGCITHIKSGVVHRLEASTEMIIVEVSTPHLDDVIRIEDDTGRHSGRIAGEHVQK